MVAEAHAAEQCGQDRKAHELDRLAAPAVDEEEGRVVAGDKTADGEDHVADRSVVQRLPHVLLLGRARRVRAETDRREDGGRVETEAVEGNVEREPRPSGTEEDFEVLPLREVLGEVGPGRLGHIGPLGVVDGVDDVLTSGEVGVDVLRGLLDVALNVHRVSGRLGMVRRK